MIDKWGKLPPRQIMWFWFIVLFGAIMYNFLFGESEVVAIIGLVAFGIAELAFLWVNRKNKWFWLSIAVIVVLAFLTSFLIVKS